VTGILVDQAVRVPMGDGTILDGDVVIPEQCLGLVLFAHGSGSSRHSPRNRTVASGLWDRGYATVLMDLLTMDEEAIDMHTRGLRFDIGLLAQRLAETSKWLGAQPDTRDLPIGYFGASTGAAAALAAAAAHPDRVAAVVSRGGRPDLAGAQLADVQAPTLLIVGSRDEVVLELNRQAAAAMSARWRLEVVPGATHLFEEPGALGEVTRLAGDWFVEHLGRS
jgi:putative phosphoribosyl transferase